MDLIDTQRWITGMTVPASVARSIVLLALAFAGASCAIAARSPSDECATNNGGCAPNAACTSAPSTHSCACKPGYVGDGNTLCTVVECGDAWPDYGRFFCEPDGLHQTICACLPPLYDDLRYWGALSGGCYTHYTGATCTPGAADYAGDCGPGWPNLGDFSCNSIHERFQTICGCHPPSHTDTTIWQDLGNLCYQRATGESC